MSAAVGVLEFDIEVPVKGRIDEWYLEIRDVGTGKLVTVIEVLSPTNKSHGAGRKKYCKKRNRIFGSNTSLIEIDLLRAGKPMPIKTREPVESDYRIMISRGKSRPRAKLLAFGVRAGDPVDPDPAAAEGPRAVARPQRRPTRPVRTGAVRPASRLYEASRASFERGRRRMGTRHRGPSTARRLIVRAE